MILNWAIKIKRAKYFNVLLGVILAFLFILIQVSYANETEQPSLPTAEGPILITSAGQSPGGMIFQVLCKRNKIESEYWTLASAENLKNFKTLIIVIGSSLKGMGSAGISMEDELIRIENLIKEARKQKMLIIGAHIEGEARRGGHCEGAISFVAPRVDYLIVRSDGNKDGRFDLISTKKEIPMTVIEETLELDNLLKEMFLKTNQDK